MKISGKIAEDQAVKFIEKKGFKILDRNYQCKCGEIDIIAREKDILCFIEVKSRSRVEWGFPEEAVNRKKQKKIIRVAKYYLQQNYAAQLPICRFDVIAIVSNQQPEIICNAFWENR